MGDQLCDRLGVSGQQNAPDAHAIQSLDSPLRLWPYCVGDYDRAEQPSVARNEDFRRSITAGRKVARHFYRVIAQEPPIANEGCYAVHHRRDPAAGHVVKALRLTWGAVLRLR